MARSSSSTSSFFFSSGIRLPSGLLKLEMTITARMGLCSMRKLERLQADAIARMRGDFQGPQAMDFEGLKRAKIGGRFNRHDIPGPADRMQADVDRLRPARRDHDVVSGKGCIPR